MMTKDHIVLINIPVIVSSVLYFLILTVTSTMIYEPTLNAQRFSAIFSDFQRFWIKIHFGSKKIQKRGQACQTEFMSSNNDSGLSMCVLTGLNDRLIMLFL